MGVAHSREKRRGGQSAQRGRARVCEFRVGELVTLKSSGAGVYQIIEAEEGRARLCNINDPLLAAWFALDRVEPLPESAAGTVSGTSPPKGPQASPGTRPRRPDSKFS
jgi:hypothetical protein